MADASDTMRYLVKSFDIAPAGTREEGQAAKGLSEVFHEHGLETANKSFRYSSLGRVPQAACLMLVGLAGVLSGVAEGALLVVMLVLALVAAALYGLEEFLGIKTVSRIGIAGSSQNVVARHPAASTLNGQNARPIVVIAHYDTPRADPLAMPLLAPVRPYLRPIVMVAAAVDLVAMVLQALPFLPGLVHNIAWAVAIVASAILIVRGLCVVLQRFAMPFTLGANDNKASIAALFGLLDRVRPLQGGPGFGPNDALYDAMDDANPQNGDDVRDDGEGEVRLRVSERRRSRADEERASSDDGRPARRSRPRTAAESRPDAPVRHGLEMVRSLGILPESCVIEYESPAAAGESAVHRASEADAHVLEAAQDGATMVMSSLAPAAAAEPAVPADPEAMKDAAADAIMAGIVGTNTLSGSQAPAPAVSSAGATQLMQPVASDAAAPAPDQAPAAPVQPFRVITSSDDYDAELHNTAGAVPPDVATQSAAASSAFFGDDPEPASVVSDPNWGTSSFRPVSAGRRILGDIPDPAVAAIDPFSVSSIEPVGNYNPEDFSGLDFETGTHQSLTPTMLEYERRRALDGFSPDITEGSKRSRKNRKGRQGRISHQAARIQAEMQEESFNDWLGLDEDFDAKTGGQQIGSWENFDDDQPGRAPRWQGGAARSRRSASRRRSEGNAAPEVRRAAMTLGDRELIAHEIWFVLAGASEADHAGVEDFLKTYRADLRGAYFINLECVGAGRQSLVIEEGCGRSVKADRRLVNLFGDASSDIGRPLALTRMKWRDTDATPLLRQGCRAVTVTGVDRGVPAHACWTGDTPEKVDPAMIDDIVDVLVEVIKKA